MLCPSSVASPASPNFFSLGTHPASSICPCRVFCRCQTPRLSSRKAPLSSSSHLPSFSSGVKIIANLGLFSFLINRSCSHGRSAPCRSTSTPTPPTSPMTCSEYFLFLSLVPQTASPPWVTRLAALRGKAKVPNVYPNHNIQPWLDRSTARDSAGLANVPCPCITTAVLRCFIYRPVVSCRGPLGQTSIHHISSTLTRLLPLALP